MKTKSFIALAGILLFVLTSCGEQQSFTKKITGDWWPVHASGSIDNDVFSAKWDGALGEHGDIEVKYISKSDPSRVVKQVVFYPALSFGKDSRKNDAMRYLDIRSLYDIKAGKYLKYKASDGKIYIEKTNENGTPTGEFDDGHPYSFPDKNTLKIDNVTYQSYSYYKETHPRNPVTEISDDSGLIPVMVYE